MNNYICDSKRLYALAFTDKDFDKLYSLHANKEVAKTTIDGVQNEEEIRNHLNDFISHQKKYGYSQFAIYEKESNKFIGRAGLTKRVLSKEVEEGIEMRFAFLPEFWHKGYASEIAFSLKNYAKDILKLKKLTASSNPKNDASNRVLAKVGFKFIKNIIPIGYGRKLEITYNEMFL